MNFFISKLAEHFEKLPGIGPRQAKRFVYALLNKDDGFISSFSKLILNLKQEVSRCPECRRFFERTNNGNICHLCSGANRDKKMLLVVEKDIDLENIEKSGSFNGFYFVLGGLIPAIGAEIPTEVKMREFFEKVKKDIAKKNLKEIILAFAATAEGDTTARYTEKILEPIAKKHPIKISRLGRGLSTGTELEYSDKETIMNAFKSRQ